MQATGNGRYTLAIPIEMTRVPKQKLKVQLEVLLRSGLNLSLSASSTAACCMFWRGSGNSAALASVRHSGSRGTETVHGPCQRPLFRVIPDRCVPDPAEANARGTRDPGRTRGSSGKGLQTCPCSRCLRLTGRSDAYGTDAYGQCAHRKQVESQRTGRRPEAPLRPEPGQDPIRSRAGTRPPKTAGR